MVCPNFIEIIEIIEIFMSTNPFVSPKQIPTKSHASPIFRLFSGTDLQRTYNGIRTEVEG